MAASRSSSNRSRKEKARTTRASSSTRAATGSRATSTSRSPARSKRASRSSDGLAGVAEQFTNRLIKPRGLVLLTRERIQETLDDAAERGRLTRSDANELVAELVNRGRQQTDELLFDLDRLVGRGRQQLDSATKKARRSEPLDRIVRGADQARRVVGVGPAFPILAYDELTASQVQQRLGKLAAPELRKVREYERQHANRKSVLSAIEKALESA
jgi:polyhydroxyalkanoate synthesis regulator phasin